MSITGFARRRLLSPALLLLATSLTFPPPAGAVHRRGQGIGARQAELESCPPSKTLVDIDEKVCPATKHRPAIVLHRACCANQKGKVKCRHFPHCPGRSPS
jgi:hypothetical protein